MTYQCSFKTMFMTAFLAMCAAMYGTSCTEDAASGNGADTEVDSNTGDGNADNDARLTWDRNLEADLAGYKVHYGTVAGDYATFTVTDVVYTSTPESPTHTIYDLKPGTYYFAVTAYDHSGNKSGYSDEKSKTIL